MSRMKDLWFDINSREPTQDECVAAAANHNDWLEEDIEAANSGHQVLIPEAA